MLRAVLPALVAVVLIATGALAGWWADGAIVSAVVLHAEPLLLVFALWGVATARWIGWPALSLGFSLGTIGFVAALRLPFPVEPHQALPPEWVSPVARCAAALKMPTEPVRVLQWTVDGAVGYDDLRGVVARAEPDVVVLHGVTQYGQVHGLAELVGGEERVIGHDGGATYVLAAGGFHPCGKDLEWTWETPGGQVYTLGFVGVPPGTIFPVLVASLPTPLGPEPGRFGGRMEEATSALLDALGGLQAASMVVVADARATRTYRRLDTRLAGLGLASVPVPPTWPAHLGRVPLLPLHPYARVWAAPAWARTSAEVVPSSTGRFAPLVATLAGARPAERAPVEAPHRKLDEPRLEKAPVE